MSRRLTRFFFLFFFSSLPRFASLTFSLNSFCFFRLGHIFMIYTFKNINQCLLTIYK